MEKSIETVYYCSNCGSSDTSSMAWVNNIDNSIEEYIGGRRDEDSNFCNVCDTNVRLMNLMELWDKFSEVPINNDDEIEEGFLCFPAGTYRFDVWHWFDERCPNGLAVDLMQESAE